jgi:hypothetical protein
VQVTQAAADAAGGREGGMFFCICDMFALLLLADIERPFVPFDIA